MSGNVPAAPGPRAVGARRGAIGGLDIFDPSELGGSFPELRIIHQIRSDKDVGRPGEYRLGKESLGKEITVAFVKAHPIRVLREGPQDKQRSVCAATGNARMPLPHLTLPRSGHCGTIKQPLCSYAQWTDGPNGKRVPPPCKLGVAFLGIFPDKADKPFWYVAGGRAFDPAWAFIQEADRAIRQDTMTPIQVLAELQVTLTTEYKTAGMGKWYQPIFTVTGELPPDKYRDLTAAVADVFYIPRVEVPDQPDDEGEPPTGTPPAGDPWDVSGV